MRREINQQRLMNKKQGLDQQTRSDTMFELTKLKERREKVVLIQKTDRLIRKTYKWDITRNQNKTTNNNINYPYTIKTFTIYI